jgi:hypothetical protein
MKWDIDFGLEKSDRRWTEAICVDEAWIGCLHDGEAFGNVIGGLCDWCCVDKRERMLFVCYLDSEAERE